GIAGFSEAVLSKIPTHFAYMFDLKYRVHSSFTLFFSILGVGLIFFVIHLILSTKKKHLVSLLIIISSLILYVAAAGFISVSFRYGLLSNDYGIAYTGLTGIFGYLLSLLAAEKLSILYFGLALVPYLTGGLSILFMMIAQIMDMAYISRLDKKEPVYAEVEETAPVHNEIKEEEIASLLGNEIAKAKESNAIVTPLSEDLTKAYRGPILVQYINTFDPKGKKADEEEKEEKEETIEEKALTADDIRRIFQEEFSRREEDKQKEAEDAEEEESIEAKAEIELLNEERAALEEETAKLLAAKRKEIKMAEEEANRLKMEKEAAMEAIAKLHSLEVAAKESKAPKGEQLSEDEVRSIIGAELEKKDQKPSGLSADDVRDIIRAELAEFLKLQVAQKPIEVAKEEPKVVEEEKKDEEPKRVVGVVNPDLPPHEKIVRIPFPVRMQSVDDELRSDYNELKAEILSYGVKSRVSNSGDTFRLHKVTFIKMGIAGKSIKMYFALNPDDYAKSTFPVTSVAHKNIYKDIPLVFKVRSDLSMKRAKKLIADVMQKNGLTQGKVVPNNYALLLKDVVTAPEKDEAIDGE
ncbi:MAG: hypothetical protein J6328_03775, partial [Bacilli bacterium]|nr:hypothetical protein [Bacilli bacterium]